MPEPGLRLPMHGRIAHPSVSRLALALALLLVAGAALPPRLAAADPPLLDTPVPSPTRSGAPKGAGTAPKPELTGRLIVHYAPSVGDAARDRVRDSLGLELAAVPTLDRTEIIAPSARGLAEATAALAKRPEVEWVEAEQRMRPMAGPTGEPYFGQQWALNNTGQTVNGFVGVPDVDMIVMASHGRSAVARWLLVSVAERIVRHSIVPVHVVPARLKPATPTR